MYHYKLIFTDCEREHYSYEWYSEHLRGEEALKPIADDLAKEFPPCIEWSVTVSQINLDNPRNPTEVPERIEGPRRMMTCEEMIMLDEKEFRQGIADILRPSKSIFGTQPIFNNNRRTH